MTKFNEMFCAVLIIIVLIFAISSCQKQEGPAEQAGKEVDKAMGNIGQQMEKAGDSIKDAAKGGNKK
ncbi:MAG: hypothetical protein WCD07_09150 [Burkholderiales bacterium]